MKDGGLAAFLNESRNERLYLRPLVSHYGDLFGHRDFVRLHQGPLYFTHVELIRRSDEHGRATLIVPAVELWNAIAAGSFAELHARWEQLTNPLQPWAGFNLDRPVVMGIVNVTPDSFSDGGDYANTSSAVLHGRSLMQAGAEIIDIGGESTRPGALPVDPGEEIRRVVPVISALAAEGVRISIDTRHTKVMAAALDAGASIINDITALHDPDAVRLAVAREVPVVIMHMQGEPQTMQDAPTYRDATLDIFDFLECRVSDLGARSLPRNRIMLDPGIGFGKKLRHNLALLRETGIFASIGCGILLGVSRKGFIKDAARDGSAADQRLGGSIAAALGGLSQGASIIRVHDVAETVQAVKVWQAIRGGHDPRKDLGVFGNGA